MRYLFLCAIGPVQEFIATARRSRDLWYGSWMLSELSKSAAQEMARQFGADNLIFPAPKVPEDDLAPGSPLGVANKIVAIIDVNDPADTGEQIKVAVQGRLRALRKIAFDKVEQNGGNFDRTLAEKQVDDLLEFYWSAVPLPDPDQYTNVREIAESLLAARKNTRNFVQPDGAHKPKSSLDGNRESVIPETAYPNQHAKEAEREQKAKSLYRFYGARPGERLSGVDLLKRLGEAGKAKDEKTPKFHSTSHFAGLSFMAMLDRKPSIKAHVFLDEIYVAYKSVGWIVSDISDDGSLLYESRLADSVPTGDALKDLQKKLNAIFEKHKISQRPSPYYALLRADGDNMGLVIDGQKTSASHRDLSQSLSAFALEVTQIVEDEIYQGKVIYAGGDDILAYLPLHTVLACAAKLESDFKEQMQKFKGVDQNREEVHPTLSAGIVIAHHLTPLSDVLAMSRDAEKKAKSIKGKNALAIVLSKRSGVDREIAGEWEVLNERLKKMTEFHREKAISKGTAYELQELDRLLADAGLPPEAIQAEALRIIKRKRESDSDKAIEEVVLEQFQPWFKNPEISIGDLAMEMIVAHIFAGALDMAEGKLPAAQEKKS